MSISPKFEYYGMPEGSRVLILTDTHKRDTDFKTIGNYVMVGDLVMMDIIEFCALNHVTHVIHAGDAFDKGYRSPSISHSDSNQFRKLKETVNGNLYKVIGNHFFIERDSNPTMFLIQPNERHKPIKPIYSDEPVMKVVDDLIVDGVQFSLHHYDRHDKGYIHRRMPEANYHIGIYHDDTMIPTSARQKLGMHSAVRSEYLTSIYQNVDEAVVAHIHTPIGLVTIQIEERIIPIDIPGSLCVCKTNELHTHVNLPMYDIKDGVARKRSVPFDIHADKLKIYEKKETVIPAGLRDNSVQRQVTPEEAINKAVNASYIGIDDYLRSRGKGKDVIDLVEIAASGNLDLRAALKIYLDKDRMI